MNTSTIRNPKFALLWPWLAAALSGILLTLCFPPWNQGWLCWIALTPLAAAAFASTGAWKRAALGYVAGFIFIVGTFWWLGLTLAELYRNAFLLSIPALLALYMGLYLAFWAWLLGEMRTTLDGEKTFGSSGRNLAIGALGASAWVAHEWMRERLFGGFGWNPLGVALHRDLAMIQFAEFTGTPGLSWLVAFTNVMAVIIVRIAVELGPQFSKRIRWEFSFTMALIALGFAFGLRRLLHPEPVPEVPLRVVAVQPNIPQTDKFDPDAEERILEQMGRLTDLAALGKPPPQLILWPESAMPRGLFASETNYRFVMDLLQRGNYSLLLGTVDFDPQTDADYNTALLLTGQGSGRQSYRKMHLVPFGEYLPLRPVFGHFLGELVPGDFTPGKEFTLLHLPEPPVRLAALVCFEDTLGDLTRRFVLKGADVLVNITNDGWFGHSPAAEQHLANAVLRAVENRRPLLRCGNTGVTGEVFPTGRVEEWVPLFEQGFAAREVRVPTNARTTFYCRHGDWVSQIAIGATLLSALITLMRRLRALAKRP